jgi:hypothetical protein
MILVYKVELSNCVKDEDNAPPSPLKPLLCVWLATVEDPPDPPPPKLKPEPLLVSLI